MAKVSIQDIAKAIAGKHGLSQNDAEKFVAALFDIINEGLHKEKIVKVKGLGTFKVIDVRERESVNVNTGERVVIESHGKITFTPDPIMRDLVNKPFAQFETVVINEGVDLDEMSKIQEDNDETEPENTIDNSEQEKNEIEDFKNTDDTGTTGDKEQDIETKPTESPTTTEHINISEQETIDTEQYQPEFLIEETTERQNEHEEPIIEKQPIATLSQEENEENTEKDIEEETPEEATPQQEQGHTNATKDELPQKVSENAKTLQITQGKWALLLISGLLFGAIMLIIGYYWGVSSVGPIVRYKTVHIISEPTSTVVEKDTLHIIDTTSAQKNNVVKTEKEATKEIKTPPTSHNNDELTTANAMVRTGAYKITGTAKTVTVKKGETLSKISKSYLGDGMECYIQVHNGITEVKEGMKLKIPKLEIKKR